MPRQFKVTVNGREYDVSVLELTAGQSTHSPNPAAAVLPVAAAASAPSAAPQQLVPPAQPRRHPEALLRLAPATSLPAWAG